jgi:antitoxin HigA-1
MLDGGGKWRWPNIIEERNVTDMPMKNPPHPGEVIREDIIGALGLTFTRAAGVLGVRRATLSDVAHGKASVSSEMALRLEKAFGVSMDLLLKMQAGYDAAQARRHSNQIKVKRFDPDAARV